MDTNTLEAKIKTDNMITWLEMEALKLGTENQRERWAAGLLPEEELLQLARAELYKGFEGCTRWNTRENRKAMAVDFALAKRHRNGCPAMNRRPAGYPSWQWEVTDVGELAEHEWNILKAIQAIAGAVDMHPWLYRAGVTSSVESLAHWITCPDCKAEATRSVAKVSIPWAGHTLVREYAL